MWTIKSFVLVAALQLSFCVFQARGSNCPFANKIFKNAEAIHDNQRKIDQLLIDSGVISTFENDPNNVLFGDNVDNITTEDFERGRLRDVATKLWLQNKSNTLSDLNACVPSADQCPLRAQPQCTIDRSLSGVCNNPEQLTWGSSWMPYARLYKANYEDYISTIKKAKISKAELPSPRIIGNIIKEFADERAKRGRDSSSKTSAPYTFSLFGFMWAQLIVHDIGNRALPNLIEHDCCRKTIVSGMGQQISSPDCYPVTVPANDDFYRKYNLTCLNFVRTYPTVPAGCGFGAIALASGPSAYIDLSIIYGTTKELSDQLRTMKGGELKTNAQNVMYEDPNCPAGQHACYIIGDLRVNQTPMLAQLHSLMLRYHNRHARELAKVNPTWSDEKLFTEARRLNIAIHQHIVFEDYLPLLMGKKASYEHGILCDKRNSKCGSYDSSINTSPLSDFMQGTFRALHVCTPDMVHAYKEDGCLLQTYKLSDVVNRPDIINYQYNGILLGQLKDPVDCKQVIYNEEIRSKLFKLANGMGTDLFAIDIHRSREHGVASYSKHYTECTGIRVRDFKDLQADFSYENLRMLSQIFESVEDMDVVTGTMMEDRDHTMTGVVARCMMGKQFHRLKYGDRYFYNSKDNPRPFTPAQIDAIESIRMSTILCQTTNLTSIELNPFKVRSRNNQPINCKDSKPFNYQLWKGI